MSGTVFDDAALLRLPHTQLFYNLKAQKTGPWRLRRRSATRNTGNEFLYTGRRRDPETGLYQYRTRPYHALLGRFVTRDWIGYLGSGNLYAYVDGRPTYFVDPSGMDPVFDLPPDEITQPIRPPVTPPHPTTTKDCNIDIYAGHCGVDAVDFISQCKEPDDGPCNYSGGNFFGVISCFSSDYEGEDDDIGIPRDKRIPGFPRWRELLRARNALRGINNGLNKAKDLAKQLCDNRKDFRDDGDCFRGPDFRRCDSVTIAITCDDDMRRLLTGGIGPDGTVVYPQNRITDYMKGLCDTKIVIPCFTEKDLEQPEFPE